MADMFLGMALASLRSLAGTAMHQLGWSGICGLAAGVLLVLAVSARLLKLLCSPRGMALTAALLLAGLAVISHKAEHAAPAVADSVWAATPAATAPALPPAGVAPLAARVTRATLIPGEYYRFRCTLCNRYAGLSARSVELSARSVDYFWLVCRYCGGRSDVNTDIKHVTDKAEILASEQEDVPHRPVSWPMISKD
jgi:hypothetical protein